MAYSDQDDLNLSDRRLIELTDSEDAPGVVDQSVIDREGVRADAICNLYLRRIYAVPVTVAIPEELKVIHSAIWRYRLYQRREVITMPQDIRDDYQMAMEQLKSIGQRDGLLLELPENEVDGSTNPVIGAMVV